MPGARVLHLQGRRALRDDVSVEQHTRGNRAPDVDRPVHRRLDGDLLGKRLEPDRLPDAGRARVPDAAVAPALLALRLPAVRGVLDVDDELVLTAGLEVAEVEPEMRVAAAVTADAATVEQHFATPVDGTEAQQRTRAPRHGERAPVAHALVHLGAAPDPGERRLERERHLDRQRLAAERELPCPVEAHPLRARGARERMLSGPGNRAAASR
jgi:hypothetical protein